MQFSLAVLLVASVSSAAAWNLTTFTDDKCTQSTGWKLSLAGGIGCISLPETVSSILVEEMSDEFRFIGSSGYACDTFHQSGGNGCYTQSQGFQSVQQLEMHWGNIGRKEAIV
ncbi:uncharacterized protein N7477_003607 [Penicillium maclennaniae]|uniref:uncharacterized protein n=1 Tax=Penicillium maclennaniae TaxID=1343394 RepID=UPI002541DE06|nr:uncharacterized protein N7477_003607 [Penicillium maclennaniae]KAJ5677974.1 hypothetical protein N7477_003607 [Penicillium maclennaniae]